MNTIVVVDKNWGIGKNNDLLFRLKKDMKFFREITTGKVVVMGANTFLSFPSGALPNRVNIVLDSSGAKHDGTISVDSVDKLNALLRNYDSNDIFVIGGASFYKLMLDRCSVAYVTKVDADGDAEVFFPNLDQKENWRLESQSENISDGNYNISFCRYVNDKVENQQ